MNELKPLNENLRADAIWTRGPSQEAGFRKVNDMVTSVPTVAFYNVINPIVVSADASSLGIVAVIMQEHDDKLRPIAFASRILS